jgi:hypothetical protein
MALARPLFRETVPLTERQQLTIVLQKHRSFRLSSYRFPIAVLQCAEICEMLAFYHQYHGTNKIHIF